MRILTAVLLLSLAVGSLAPGVASATVPPGNSGAEEYAEAYPAAGGNKPNSGSGARSETPSRALGAANATRLESAGPEGRATAELAARTAPAGGGDAATGSPGSQGKRAKQGVEGSGGGGIAAVAKRAFGSADPGGMGLLLPVILILTLLLAVTATVAGKRRNSSS